MWRVASASTRRFELRQGKWAQSQRTARHAASVYEEKSNPPLLLRRNGAPTSCLRLTSGPPVPSSNQPVILLVSGRVVQSRVCSLSSHLGHRGGKKIYPVGFLEMKLF